MALDCNTSLSNWLKSIEDPNLWSHKPYDENDLPLDMERPIVEINIPYLEGRKRFRKRKVVIQTQEGIVLLVGDMHNGKMKHDLEDEMEPTMLSEWKSRLIVQITDSKMSPDNNIYIQGSFKNGKLHGLVQIYGQQTVNPKGHCSHIIFQGISFLGWYENGKPIGLCWRHLIGSTYLYGIVDQNGEFTGSDIAFIYQDLEIALVGKFKKGIMISGREARVIGSTCDEHGIRVLKFSEPYGPVFHYEEATNVSLGDHPYIRDPLDKEYVYVKESTIESAGEGLYAAKDIPKDTQIVLYGGYLYNKKQFKIWAEKLKEASKENGWVRDDPELHSELQNNIELFPDENDSYFKKHFGNQHCFIKIIIPPKESSMNVYQATLGHKANHNFGSNIHFAWTETARFGLLLSFKTTVPIKKGEEIFSNYGYKMELAPKWYRDDYKKFVMENPSLRDEDILQEIESIEAGEDLYAIYDDIDEDEDEG